MVFYNYVTVHENKHYISGTKGIYLNYRPYGLCPSSNTLNTTLQESVYLKVIDYYMCIARPAIERNKKL
jgi:hypothetical protein